MKNEERILTLLEGLVVQVADLNVRFDKLETRFGTLETRFDKLETRFDKIEVEITTIKSDIAHLVRVNNEVYKDIGMLDYRTEHLQKVK